MRVQDVRRGNAHGLRHLAGLVVLPNLRKEDFRIVWLTGHAKISVGVDAERTREWAQWRSLALALRKGLTSGMHRPAHSAPQAWPLVEGVADGMKFLAHRAQEMRPSAEKLAAGILPRMRSTAHARPTTK